MKTTAAPSFPKWWTSSRDKFYVERRLVGDEELKEIARSAYMAGRKAARREKKKEQT